MKSGAPAFQALVIRGGEVYDPQPRGVCDIIVFGGRIVAVGGELEWPFPDSCTTIDADGLIVVPGFIDLHLHVIGGGGVYGPTSRTCEVPEEELVMAGVTTVVGLLGFDSFGFGLRALHTRLLALSRYGLTSLAYSGSYTWPPATLTGSITSDLVSIERVVGVKVALGEPLAGPIDHSSIMSLGAETWRAAALAGKPGVVNVHVGECAGRVLEELRSVARLLPRDVFVPTHLNRTVAGVEAAVKHLRAGGNVDFTCCLRPELGIPGAIPVADVLARLHGSDVPWENVTVSSDGGASQGFRDSTGSWRGVVRTPVDGLLREVRQAVVDLGVPIEKVLATVTTNPASRLGLENKGVVRPGADADLVLLTRDWTVDTVIAGGKVLAAGGRSVLSKGVFDAPYMPQKGG